MKKLLLGLLVFLIPTIVFAKGYEIISGDLDTIGSIVRIGTEEFYVIGKEDATHVKLLSKYNLGVGKGFDNPTYKQDKEANGTIDYYQVATEPTKGTVKFSDTDYWWDSTNSKSLDKYGEPKTLLENLDYTINVYDDNCNLKQYVDKYVDMLCDECVSVEGRLITREEVNALGCINVCVDCDRYSFVCESPYDWLVKPTYWIGSATIYTTRDTTPYKQYSSATMVTSTMARGPLTGYGQTRWYSNADEAGVRPLIILDTAADKVCPEETSVVKTLEENPPTGVYSLIPIGIIITLIGYIIYNIINKKNIFKKI